MTHYMIAACILLAAVAAVAALFIRRAVLYRRRLHRAEAAPQPQPPRRQENYEEVYLKSGSLRMRQPVYISRETHRSVVRLVHLLALAGKKISVGGYIDNVLAEHLRQHREEIAGLCRDHTDDLL